MPRSSPDTSWLFFEEKNVSHWVGPGAFVIFVTFRTEENWWHRHKQYPDTTFTRFYSVPPSTTLTCCWPPGRSSSATAASTFATKAPPVGSKLSPSSALLFLSWPSTSDDPISIKFRRQSWIGLARAEGAQMQPIQFLKGLRSQPLCHLIVLKINTMCQFVIYQ